MHPLLSGARRALLGAAVAALCASSVAAADDGATRLHLAVAGECPSEAALRVQLRPLVRLVADPDSHPDTWTLAVEAEGGRARLRLDAPSGRARGLERELRSRDCEALASLARRIVERHLSSLDLPLGVPEPPHGGADGSAPAARADEASGRPTDASALPGSRRWVLRVLVGAGPRLEVGPGVAQGVPTVGATLGLASSFRVGLALDVLTPWTLSAGDETLDLVGAGLRGQLGLELPLGSSLRLVPYALLRLGMVWLSPRDLPDAPGQLTRVLGEVGLGAELSWEPTPGFELWLAIDARAPLNIERYRIEPTGVVGTSADAVLETTLGLAVRTNP